MVLRCQFKCTSTALTYMCVLNVQINIRDIKVYYMEDDGGSPITNGVSRCIKAAVQKVIEYLESAHGIKGQKVSQQNNSNNNNQIQWPILSQSLLWSPHFLSRYQSFFFLPRRPKLKIHLRTNFNPPFHHVHIPS
jgi:hypothetical protein